MDYFTVDEFKRLVDQYAIPFGLNLLVATLIFLIGRRVARALSRALDRLMGRSKIDDSLRRFMVDVSYALLLAIVVITALDRLGVKTTAVVAIFGAAALAVGFALQGSLGNFSSGVLIILFKPYRLNDVVNVAGYIGRVDDIKIFSTVLVTGDNRQVTIPNGQITAGSIENLTIRGTRRVDMTFGIGYGDDIALAKQILERVVKEDARVLADPAPTIAVAELGDSSVNLACRPWVAVADYWGVLFDLTERVKNEFDAAGVSIPFPQRDVHLHQVVPAQVAPAQRAGRA
jgi:small conductance mechanosensitive channel